MRIVISRKNLSLKFLKEDFFLYKKNGFSNFLDCPVFHFLKQKGFTLTYIVCLKLFITR